MRAAAGALLPAAALAAQAARQPLGQLLQAVAPWLALAAAGAPSWPQQQHQQQLAQRRWASSGGASSGVSSKRLGDIIKLPLLVDKTADEVEAIWLQHHTESGSHVGSVASRDDAAVLAARAAASPLFLLPLRKPGGGFVTLLGQWQGDPAGEPAQQALVTTLEEFRSAGAAAAPHFAVTVYGDLAASHGLALLRGDVLSPRLVSAAEVEAIWLQHHTESGSHVGSVASRDDAAVLAARAAASPLFLLPLRKPGGGFVTLLGQWQGDPAGEPAQQALVTTLEEFRSAGAAAAPHFAVTVYGDLAASHGLALLRGDVLSPRLVSAAEGRTVLELARALYVDGGSFHAFVHPFNHDPRAFDFSALLEELGIAALHAAPGGASMSGQQAACGGAGISAHCGEAAWHAVAPPPGAAGAPGVFRHAKEAYAAPARQASAASPSSSASSGCQLEYASQATQGGADAAGDACEGWFSKCRGCGCMTAHEQVILGAEVPFCKRCQSTLDSACPDMKTKMVDTLLYVHHAWSSAGL
ncbi:atpaf1 [Scenedesmus sp. PABB004]|nr:atpaf1 [Scenedesmus sp. PABB004]